MDRSGPYRAVVQEQLPQADIVFDKFHLIANYNEVIDEVRRRSQREANRTGEDFVTGQRYNLFRRPANLRAGAKTALRQLLEANADLHLTCENWVAIALDAGIHELSRFAKGLLEA